MAQVPGALGTVGADERPAWSCSLRRSTAIFVAVILAKDLWLKVFIPS